MFKITYIIAIICCKMHRYLQSFNCLEYFLVTEIFVPMLLYLFMIFS